MEPIRLWGCADDPYFVRSEPSPYGEGYHEYAALPRAEFDALVERAEEAARSARLSEANEAFLDTAIALWQAQERVDELDAECGASKRDREDLSEARLRFMRFGNEARMAEWYSTDAPQAGTSVERGGAANPTPTGSTPVKAPRAALREYEKGA